MTNSPARMRMATLYAVAAAVGGRVANTCNRSEDYVGYATKYGDGAGDFAIRVGMPAKSGVGGGILSVAPSIMGIGIYGPALDSKGNSVAGIKLLEKLSSSLYLSVF